MARFLLLTLFATFALALPKQTVLKDDVKSHEFAISGDHEVRRFPLHGLADVGHVMKTVKELELDVWHLNGTIAIDIRMPSNSSNPFPDREFSVQSFLDAFGRLPDSIPGPWNLTSLQNSTFHQTYHPTTEIHEFLTQLSKDFPKYVTLLRLGHSSEGKPLLAVRIGNGKRSKGKYPKLGFVIQGAQHAREWVATAAALYFAHSLVVPHSRHEPYSHHNLLNNFDFHIIPLPNPDGYDYTWTTDRFYYKNRQSVGKNGKCKGIDMNRNWGSHWLPSNDPYADPCSHWYPGSRPFESPEVNAVAGYITRTSGIAAFIDLRSYGQMLSFPFSYSCDTLPRDAEDQIEAALGAAQAFHKVHGQTMTTGRLCELLYSAPGNVVDWMYESAGIKYVYAAHLRDTGTHGFELPAPQIRPVGEETAALLAYFASFIDKKRRAQIMRS